MIIYVIGGLKKRNHIINSGNRQLADFAFLQVGWLLIFLEVIPLDIATNIYVSPTLLDKINELNTNGELRTDTISLLDCILTVKLMSDGSGRYLLKLIDK